MKTSLTLFSILFILAQLPAQLINEFEPNPDGGDPGTQDIELKGTPGASITGNIISIDSDDGQAGQVDRITAFAGTFDAGGFLIVNVNDLENPSFTLVLTLNDAAVSTMDDVDGDNDGTIDDPSVLGTVLDAIGVPDVATDEDFLYGWQLGGTDFQFTGSEPELIFRDGVSNVLFAVNDLSVAPSSAISSGGTVIDGSDFSADPAIPTFSAINPSTSVAPVDLFDFKVAKRANSIELNWSTINETGNDYFAVERSSDNGRTFVEIGRAKGAGNSRNFNAYDFQDDEPVKGTAFYRLRQVDFDGTTTFYGPISVEFIAATTTVSVFPNPARESIRLRGLVSSADEIQIFNAIGRLVRAVGGSEAILNEGAIDISDLHRGVYLLKYRSGSERGTLRFVKR